MLDPSSMAHETETLTGESGISQKLPYGGQDRRNPLDGTAGGQEGKEEGGKEEKKVGEGKEGLTRCFGGLTALQVVFFNPWLCSKRFVFIWYTSWVKLGNNYFSFFTFLYAGSRGSVLGPLLFRTSMLSFHLFLSFTPSFMLLFHGTFFSLYTTCINISSFVYYRHYTSHVTPGFGSSDPICRSPSAQPRTQLSMATCPGQRTMEATRGNGYAPAWGSLVVMMMIIRGQLTNEGEEFPSDGCGQNVP